MNAWVKTKGVLFLVISFDDFSSVDLGNDSHNLYTATRYHANGNVFGPIRSHKLPYRSSNTATIPYVSCLGSRAK